MKPKVKDPFSESQILFFKMPLLFQNHQSSLSPSEKDIYTVFCIQMKYKKSRWLQISADEFCYWTGIKNPVTVYKALRGLVAQGWIGDIRYQKDAASIYLVNLEPVVNPELLEKVLQRSKNTSEAKKKSIANGETGKFEKGHQIRKKP